MKPLRLNAPAIALLSALLLLAGCQHKKPVPIVPQQAPPTAAAEASPTPEQPAQPAATDQNQEQATAGTPAPADQTQTAAQKDKAVHPKKPSPRKPAPANADKTSTEARNNPPKRIIPAEKAEPTPAAGQISPGPTPAEAGQNQVSTEQLLQSAENNLNGIKRQLSKDEDAMRTQAREFISQSRKAIGENDPARAHILAVKAQLLSVELTRQR